MLHATEPTLATDEEHHEAYMGFCFDSWQSRHLPLDLERTHLLLQLRLLPVDLLPLLLLLRRRRDGARGRGGSAGTVRGGGG